MATISSSGIGSGLDVNSIVTQLMNVEKQPLTQLDTKEAGYQAKLSAFGTLKSAFSSLQTAVRSLKSTSLYSAMSAQSSSTSVLAASANTAAQAGTYSVQVVDRAQAQVIASQAFGSLTSDISSYDGKIRIELGTFTPATTAPPAAASFVADPDRTAVTIDIAAGSSSLQDIRDKINGANAGVKANIVYVGNNQYKLTVTAAATGAKSSIKLTTLTAADAVVNNNADLAKLSFDPTVSANSGNEFAISTYAQDAHLKIDGLDIYRSSNTISDALTGITLTAVASGTSTLSVTRDNNSIKAAFDGFVKAYNDANSQLRELTAYNAETGKGSLLTADSAARSLQTAMRELLSGSRSSINPNLRSLSDLGLSLQRDGSLQFNSATLGSALASSGTEVATMMTSDTAGNLGLGLRMATAMEGILSRTGIITSRTDGISRSIADIGEQRQTLNRRLASIEKRYRTQFSALDTLVAGMQKTSQFLTQQLASLPSSSSG